jgi:PLP dependent protein
MTTIAENFEKIRTKIRKAERQAGREEGACALIAVTKTQSEDAIRAALACGQRLFGENKVQEAQAHWTHLKSQYPDIALHLIGPLQSNKAAEAVALFDCIETIDREKIALAVAGEIKKQNRTITCYVQVNTGEEDSKAGIAPRDCAAFVRFCRDDARLPVTGLMCIPPLGDPPALHFALLKKLVQQSGLKYLSMGMSEDFEKAIALGATHVRIGTALFGPRH